MKVDGVAELRVVLLRWKAHFGIVEVRSFLRDFEKWTLRRPRYYQWKQWGKAGIVNCAIAESRCRKPEIPVYLPISMAVVENTGVNSGVASENLQQYETASLVWITMRHDRVVDFRNAGYVIRMSGAVGVAAKLLPIPIHN